MAPQTFAVTPNIKYIWNSLQDGTLSRMSGGRIPRMNATQAAGLIGSWIVETGRRGLDPLDVKEIGRPDKGRGLGQYTGARRAAYDRAVSAAKSKGQDINSAQWQLQYMADEYAGKHDTGGKSLIGYTKVFEGMPKNLRTPAEYARYFTGSAAEGKGYFRPGTPHQDRRNSAANEVFKALGDNPANSMTIKGKSYKPNSSVGAPIVQPQQGTIQASRAADYLAKQNEANLFKTNQNPLTIKNPTYTNYLPSLGDIAKAGIGDLGQFRSSSSQYGGRVFSDSFNAPAITNTSYRSNINLGSTIGIKPIASNYTWAASAPAASAWKTGFGIR